jgi:hypothetical protein
MSRALLAAFLVALAGCAGSTKTPATPMCTEGCRAELIGCKQVCPDQDAKPEEHAACEAKCQQEFTTCSGRC